MNLRLLPLMNGTLFKGADQTWAMEARLLRWLTFVWLLIGLVAVFSASYVVGDADSGDGLYYFKRQVFWVVVGLVGFEALARIPVRKVLGWAPWGLAVILGMIFLTLVPGLGTTVNGATRWLSIGGIEVQPSEFIKPFLILQGACLFSQWRQTPWKTRLFWLGVFGFILACILLQPNLSTTALCGMALWLMALAGGVSYFQLGATALGGVGVAALSIGTREYQMRRVMSFLNPWADPQQDGYQLIQSLLAVGSGGPWGVGFGLSQQKLFYLPIQYTDFIFAIFAEEFGFLGCVALLLLLAFYTTFAMAIALRARLQVHQLVMVGGVIFLVGQSLLNVGVATGVLPTTGLPFPLLSYGGSSMISSLAIAGLMVRVTREISEADVLMVQQAPVPLGGRSGGRRRRSPDV